MAKRTSPARAQGKPDASRLPDGPLDNPTPGVRLDEIEAALLSALRYSEAVAELTGTPPSTFGEVRDVIVTSLDAIAERRAQAEPITYLDVVDQLGRVVALGEGLPKIAYTRSRPLFALPVAPVPYPAMGTVPILASLTPAQIAEVCAEIEAMLRELYNRLGPADKERILKYLLAIFSILGRIREAGLTAELLAQLNAEMRALFELLKYLGGGEHLREVFRRLFGFMLRFAQGLGGAGGAAGFVLVDFLVLLVGLLMWFWLWVQIGTWLWNREVGDSGQTYTDWWGDAFYGVYRVLKDLSCDELLERWRKADRDLRNAEAAGMSLAQRVIRAINAKSLAEALLSRCPLDIRNVIVARLAHYRDVMAQFDASFESH